MGRGAFGFKRFEDDHEVVYSFANISDEIELGELVISVEDPSQWHVRGGGPAGFEAKSVYSKAVRRFEETGEWPHGAAKQS